MAWRVLEIDDRQWNVSVAAERRAHSEHWNLVLAFRAVGGGAPSVWAEYPLSSSSRSSLLQQADRIPDHRLIELLADRLR